MLPGIGSSQNLILNPSLEDFEQCPTRLGSFNTDVAEWSSPTQGSTDYFNGCSTSMGTPENFNGSQPADFGQGYAGLYMYAPDDYREYVQAKLRQTLIKGETYELSFYISLAESSDYAVKEFEALFAEKLVSTPIKKVLSKMHLYKDKVNAYHFVTISYSDFYRDTQDWIPVSTLFEANGTENFLIIGNFKDNDRTHKFKTNRDSKRGAYYYLDMIALQPAHSGVVQTGPGSVDIRDSVPEYELDKLHTFKSVLFNFDNFELLHTAQSGIQEVYDYLKANPAHYITLSGHTDITGNEAYNMALSTRRCLAVAEYMIGLGLSPERISWQGYGGTRPVADNDTEQGRKLNRRVEYQISLSGGR